MIFMICYLIFWYLISYLTRFRQMINISYSKSYKYYYTRDYLTTISLMIYSNIVNRTTIIIGIYYDHNGSKLASERNEVRWLWVEYILSEIHCIWWYILYLMIYVVFDDIYYQRYIIFSDIQYLQWCLKTRTPSKEESRYIIFNEYGTCQYANEWRFVF
jgi:hypothetical protein